MCLKEIRLHVQNTITIIGSIVNMIGKGDLYDQSDNEKIFTRALRITRKVATTSTRIGNHHTFHILVG